MINVFCIFNNFKIFVKVFFSFFLVIFKIICCGVEGLIKGLRMLKMVWKLRFCWI